MKLRIFSILNSHKSSGEHAKRLRWALGSRLLSISPSDALKILVDACANMKLINRTLPTVKDLILINTCFLGKAHPYLKQLPVADGLDSQHRLLFRYLLAAGFLAREKGKIVCSREVQLELLRWTKAFPELSKVPAEISNGIRAAISDWNPDYRKIITGELDSMHASVRKAVASAVEATPVVIENEAKAAEKASFSTQMKTFQPPIQYDALHEVSRLGDFIREQERRLRSATEELGQNERDLVSIRSELEAARLERDDLKRTSASQKERLEQARNELDQMKKSRDQIEADLSNTRSALKDCEVRNRETLQLHSTELDNMSERIAAEGDHQIETFKRKLQSRLSSYGLTLQEAEGMEMTDELGKSLLIQLKQLLKLLKSEGINI